MTSSFVLFSVTGSFNALIRSQVLYNVFDAFVTLGGSRINAAEIIKGIGIFLQTLPSVQNIEYYSYTIFKHLIRYLHFLHTEIYSLEKQISLAVNKID